MQYSISRRKSNQDVDGTSSSTTRLVIPHRGTLRRVHHSSPPSSGSSSKSRKSKRTSSSSSSTACSSSFVTYVMSINVPSHHNQQQFQEEYEEDDMPFHPSPPSQYSTNSEQYELVFDRQQYEFCSRLFSILDTESRGSIGRQPIREFVDVRCPVFQRRDNAIRNQQQKHEETSNVYDNDDNVKNSPSFDEVWNAVVSCSRDAPPAGNDSSTVELGVEGWMVFCRFIALAQYQEAKRRFSSRHKQQTMRHRHGGRGSEVVVVNVPPPDPPAPINVTVLVAHERKTKSSLPLPELDLDHCLVSTHDTLNRTENTVGGEDFSPLKNDAGVVSISIFGLPSGLLSSTRKGTSSTSHNLEFVLTYTSKRPTLAAITADDDNNVIVRRSFADMEWLHDTFVSHKTPGGGTLCGRILPPFPKTKSKSSSSDYGDDIKVSQSSTESNTEMAVNAAKTGVGMITSMAKSFWGSYVTTSSPPAQQHHQQGGDDYNSINSGVSDDKARVVKSLKKRSGSSSTRKKDKLLASPSCKARHLERYLNYLLEHPALSTSFPLNAILKSSQSGLESAKRILDEQSKSSYSQQDRFGKSISQMDHNDQAKMSSLMFWSSPLSSSSPLGVSSSSSHQQQPNMTWVRTAAQAAMALKVHGILETTGCSTASAKLQHASLPNFGSSSQKKGNSSWADEDGVSAGFQKEGGKKIRNDGDQQGESKNDDCFENGVVSVESELDICDAGYDMLPNPVPVPAPEKVVLCAGSSVVSDDAIDNGSISVQSLDDGGVGGLVITNNSNQLPPSSNRMAMQISQKFRYGASATNADERAQTLLGDMAVDDDIDKLREIIGSVDNILGRCFASSAGIGRALRQRNALHLGVVQSVDSWEGMRGEIITQRALLDGLSMLAGSSEVAEECSQTLSEDLSWQSSLASSAVSAAEDVRAAVRASKTATRAKAAAESAALTAQKSCDNKKFSSVDEARAAQTRASIAQGHAIHSAVVEHEAMAAKRRAALALAHDVKCWNVHRKRELFRTCKAVAQAQLEASRQAVDAWTKLRSGLLDSSLVSLTDEKIEAYTSREEYFQQAEEASAVIYGSGSSSTGADGQSQPLIVPVDHVALSQTPFHENKLSGGVRFSPSSVSIDEFVVPEEIIGSSSFSQEQQTSILGKEDGTTSEIVSEDHVPLSTSTSQAEKGPLINTIKDDSSNEASLCVNELSSKDNPDSIIPSQLLVVEGEEDMLGESIVGTQFCTTDLAMSGRNEVQSTSNVVMDRASSSDDGGTLLLGSNYETDGAKLHEGSFSGKLSQSNEQFSVPNDSNDFDIGLHVGTFDTSSDPFQSHQSILQESSSQKIENNLTDSQNKSGSLHVEGKNENEGGAAIDENNILTDSMQSLVDGLMTWGGQYDSQDDLTLPTGMAASIALEESGLLE